MDPHGRNLNRPCICFSMPIDFENKTYLKLRSVSNTEFEDLVRCLVPPGETIMQTYKSGRDGVVFTGDRLIVLNIKGLTGKQKSITVIPFNKINAYNIETAAVIDMDSTLTIWVNGISDFTFEFSSKCDLGAICRCINSCNRG